MSDELLAPEGKIWVCCACGKVSKHKYGDHPSTSRGWDVSCVMNSQMFDQDKLVWNDDHTRVIEVKEV